MSDRKYVIAYGDGLDWRVSQAPESYGPNLLTRAEAAERIVDQTDVWLAEAKETRRRALRVLRAEQKKVTGPEVTP